MNTTNTPLWTSLHSAGLVTGTAPIQTELTSPWYVKVLLGFSGWLAALFLLGFIGAGFVFIVKNEIAAIITGIAMIGVAFALLQAAKNEFLEHLALAVSLAGQALVIFGIFQLTHQRDDIAWVILTLFEIPIVLIIPNFVHRVMTTVIAAMGFYMSLDAFGAAFVFSGIILFIVAWLWLNEFRYPRLMRMFQAIGYGLVFALLPLKGSALFGYRSIGWYSGRSHPELWVQPWMGELLIAVVFIYVVWRLLQRYHQPLGGVFTTATLFAALIVSLASMQAQGITVGIVILLLGFSSNNRILVGLGIVSLLFFVSSYYYLLNTTLLVKAGILFSVGVILLGARWVLMSLLPTTKGTQDVQ